MAETKTTRTSLEGAVTDAVGQIIPTEAKQVRGMIADLENLERRLNTAVTNAENRYSKIKTMASDLDNKINTCYAIVVESTKK